VQLGGDVIEGVVGQGAPNRIAILLVEPAKGGEGFDGLGGFILRVIGNAHSVWPLVQGKGGWVLSGAYTGVKAPVDGPVAEVGQGHPQNQPAKRVAVVASPAKLMTWPVCGCYDSGRCNNYGYARDRRCSGWWSSVELRPWL
jgi:hypothetical protein